MLDLEMTNLEKRLISLQSKGIYIASADRHRWLYSTEVVDHYSFHDRLAGKGIYPSNKVYGTLLDALNYVDYLLGLLGEPSLLDSYSSTLWGLDLPSEIWETETPEYWADRVGREEIGVVPDTMEEGTK